MNLQNIFLDVLNMSITAGWMIAAVVAFRLLLRGFPRVFSYLLWAVVYFRLLCPVSFTSIVSLLNLFGDGRGISVPISPVAEQTGSVLASSIEWAVSAQGVTVPYLFEMSLIWAAGVVVTLMYGLLSYLKLRKLVRSALPMSDGVRLCDSVDIPFVLGILKPIIYLPTTIKDKEYSYILRHEQIHLLRRDYIIKPIAYLALCLHWFNPMAWLSMRLMTCDMEMSCDEMVLNRMGEGIKRSYSHSLLQMASEKPFHSLHMLAFGETDTKRRIKNVLKYKRPIGKNIAVAVCLVAAVSLAMLANPAAAYANEKPADPTPSITVEPTPLPKPTPMPTKEPVTEPAATPLPVQEAAPVEENEPEPNTEPEPTPDPVVPKEPVAVPLPGEEGAITLHHLLGNIGYISAGVNEYPGHTGTDFTAPAGTEIYAAQSGTVVYASNKNVWPYGKHVIVDHGNGWQTLYAHCREVLVEVDDEVAQDSLIAKVGKSGNANGNHCHLELRYNGEIANPEDYTVAAE